MTEFQQFDISGFFNELQEPLVLIDAEEIIFYNQYFNENFKPIQDDWRLFFDSQELIASLDEFFQNGNLNSSQITRPLISLDGKNESFEWSFVNLSSSYQSRFLVAKGSHVKVRELAPNEQLATDGAVSEELSYIRSILKNTHDLIAILDVSGNFKYISDSIVERLGLEPRDVLGKNFKEFASKRSVEIVKGDYSEVLRSDEEVAFDFWLTLKSGKRIYLENFAKNLLDHPQVQGILVSSRDITEYIHSENALQQRYEIENLIIRISSRLINGSFRELEADFFSAIAMFGEFLKAKHAEILVFNRETETLDALNSWTSGKEGERHFHLAKQELGLIFENHSFLEKGKVRLISAEFSEHHAVRDFGNSRILIPMISGNRLLGVIRFESDAPLFSFEEKEIQVLRQLGDILAGAYLASQMTMNLEHNENLLSNAEIMSKSGSWRYSTQTGRFLFSGGFANLFGLGSKPISQNFYALIFRIDKPFRLEFIKKLKLAIHELTRSSGEFTSTDKNGKVRFFSYEIDGKRDFLSQGPQIVGSCTDISHKRASDSYLRLQSQILAQVSDPILVTNLDFEVIYLNETAALLCGLNASEKFEGYLEDLVSIQWNEGEELKRISSNLKIGEVWKSERFVQTGATAKRPFEISIQAIHAEGKEKICYSVILRDLEEKYKSEQISKSAQLIVENSPAVLFRIDPNEEFRVHYISENISRFGYDAAYLIKNRISFLDLLHPEDSEKILAIARKGITTEGVPAFSGEYRIKTASGNFVWVEDRTRDVVSDSGKIVLHEGLFQDISDRKNLEEIQKQKDLQYRVLAANIPKTNIFLMDSNRTYILAEGTNFEKWGLSKEDFEGKELKDLQLTPYEEIKVVLDRVYNNQEIVESEFFLKGRYYHRTIRPIILNEKVEYALSIVRDIHEEFQAKLDLQQSEEKYRRLVEESTEIIFSLTETFMLHYVSPNVKQYLGYDSLEVTGRSIFDFLNPDDLDVFLEILNESKDFLAKNQFLEFRLRHKNGEYRVFNSNGKLIEDKSGIHRYYTGVARDISKLKETQRELLLAKENAEQASKVKSQFLSVMSHEIRTPMNAVIGLAHFLMEENPRPDQLENLKTLQFSAENLMALINDILDFNKIDSGKVELEQVPFDLRNIIHRIVHSHTFQANEKGLKVSCVIDEAIPETLIGDSLRIGQVINNLVSNSIKFTERGFIRISIFREYTEGNQTDIRFVFEDTGIGIPENKRKSIFEAFTQATSSTSRKYGGTGLGLAIVKRLVELFGGDIELSSRKGGGSVFEFTIPLEFVDTSKLEADKAVNQANLRSLEKASILVAEDNTINQILIRKFLTKWNTGNLVITSDGLEALEQFNLGQFDLVLLDLQMPGMDGFGVAQAIRSHIDPAKQTVPILALTASSYNEVKLEMKESGMNDFVPKPFTPEILYEKILKYLQPKERDEIPMIPKLGDQTEE